MKTQLLLEFGKSFLFVLATLVPILNPAATAPIFLNMTKGASSATRISLAGRIARNIFWLIAGSMLVGSYVLNFFGISLPIVRIGGGLILASMAWSLLNAMPQETDKQPSLAESFTPEHAKHQAFYPLTFPISCGPGTISVAITLGATLYDSRLQISLAKISGALLALLFIAAMIFFAFRYAHQTLHLLGDTGAAVFLRLSSFILLCLGVQIIWSGLSELLQHVLSSAFRS